MSQTPLSEEPVGGASIEPAAASGDSTDGSAQAPHGLAGSRLPATGPVVLDASFVIALLRRDPGANALAHVLPRGVMTSVTAGEVFTAIAEAGGPDPERVEGVLRALGVSIVELPLTATRRFPELRHIDAARGATGTEVIGVKVETLQLGDLCVLSYALATGAPVLSSKQQRSALIAYEVGIEVFIL